jgi:hypothetical protein
MNKDLEYARKSIYAILKVKSWGYFLLFF